MLMKQNRMLTYMCPECGLTFFTNINIFDFSGKKEVLVQCKCAKSAIKIVTNNHKTYAISISSSNISSHFRSVISLKEMWIAPLTILNPELSRVDSLFIGDEDQIIQQLDLIEKSKDLIAKSIGLKIPYANSSVMLETLNQINDIAEKGNVMCECGSKDVSIHILKEKIVLKCMDCKCRKSIRAKDTLDLKNNSQLNEIILYSKNKYNLK